MYCTSEISHPKISVVLYTDKSMNIPEYKLVETGACLRKRYFVRISISMETSPCCNYVAIRSQQIFVHVITARFSCHVQNFVAIDMLVSKWESNQFPSNLNCDGNPVGEMSSSLFHRYGTPRNVIKGFIIGVFCCKIVWNILEATSRRSWAK